MIDVRKLVKVADIADRESSMLASTMRRSNIINNVARAKLYKEEEKLQRLREDTFSALSKELGGKGKKGGLTGVLMGALGLGGAGGVVRRFGGGGRGGSGNVPKLPRGPLGKSLSKFGRIGPLAIASTGLDFFARKQSGQSNLQAGGGALAGLGGFAGGAKIGATLGTMIAPGVGTAVGGVLGGALGGLAGGNLFDRLYGQNMLRAGSDFRRVQEEERTRQQKTLFGENLDQFDVVLDKFAKKAPRLRGQDEDDADLIAERIRRLPSGVRKVTNTSPPALLRLIDTLFNALIVAEAVGTKRVPTLTPSLKITLRNLLLSKKARKGSKFLEFSKNASKIKPETLAERMTRAFEKTFGKRFNPALSKKGQLVREGNKALQQEQRSNRLAKIFKFIKTKVKTPGRLDRKVSNKFLDNKFKKEIFQGKEQVFRSKTENDAIANVVRKVLREGDVGSANLTEREKKIFKGFKDSISDMVDSDLLDKNSIDELYKFLQKSEIGGEGINFEKVIKQLKNTPLGSDILKNKEGGVMSGPETGYLAVLHGKERIIPEENQHTRSKGGGQRMKTNTIMMVEGNNSQPQQIMQTPKTQVVPIFVPADPFDVATKYSELIAKVTV